MINKQPGLKYKFMLITIVAIVATTVAGSALLHWLITWQGEYSLGYLVITALFFVAAGILGVLAVSRFMIQPVVYLTERIHQVRNGNLDVKIERRDGGRRQDEMDQLFDGFAHMVSTLRENIAALTRAKEHAESASRELFESKRKLEAIFSGISDGIMILDRDYRIVGANPVIQNFMGRPLNEITGQHCYQMCNGTPHHCSFCQAQITFAEGRHVTSYCTKMVNDHGGERILEIHDFPLFNEQGEVEQIIEYVKDVTEALKMQARLESSRRLAEMGELAAKVAHEVRNPLNAIKGATHYLRSTENGEAAEYLGLIEEQVDRVNQVATELLDLSRPLSPAFHPGSLAGVVESSLRAMQAEISACAVEIETAIEPHLPMIPIDEHQMQQVLVNLIQNSLDAMPQGGRIYISVSRANGRLKTDEPSLMLAVRDEGCGMDPRQCENIFNPFFTTKVKGTGLGLTIVKKIIDHHQGRIQVNSRPGMGTETILTLPLQPRKHEDKKYHIGR